MRQRRMSLPNSNFDFLDCPAYYQDFAFVPEGSFNESVLLIKPDYEQSPTSEIGAYPENACDSEARLLCTPEDQSHAHVVEFPIIIEASIETI